MVFRISWVGACGLLFAIAGSARADEVNFRHDEMAVLSKAGCNAGTCHGNFNGKGGFFLSLRGQDPKRDYRQLVHAHESRRINRVAPEQSLILLKPTTQAPHQGGHRFDIGSLEYEILRRWIAAGLPGPDAPTPELVKLEVTPRERVLVAPVESVPLKAVAHFADGTSRDVTRLAVYEPTDTLRVEVDHDGLATRKAFGATNVIARYLDKQVPARLAFVPQREGFHWSDPPPRNYIDEHIFARLKQLRLNPAPLSKDTVFVRRVYLDLLGVLPTADEAREFVADARPDKRARLVDALLARPEFAERWALHWGDLLRAEEKALDKRGLQVLHDWMRDGFAEDKPLNQFVAELIAARGSTYKNPPANFWRAHRKPLVRSEAVAQVFLGVRLKCCKCHNHPFDHWTQDEYYQWTSVFARVDYKIVENKRKDKLDKHEFVGEQIVLVKDEGAVKNARTGKPAKPHFLGVEKPVEGDRLKALAAWLTSPDNRRFAKAQTNRIWYHLMGRGLVVPVDDLRATNPASHPELFEALTDDFVEHGFSLRHLVKRIVLSRTYQLSAIVAEADAEQIHDERNYDRAIVRRLSAEKLLDAQSQVLGVPAKFEGYPVGTRAGQLPGGANVGRGRKTDGDRFLTLFGKPVRLLSSECERSNEPTLGHALSLVGGENLHARLKKKDNRIGKLLKSDRGDAAIIDELFWTALSRPPSEREQAAALALIEETGDRRAALEDLTWALLNAKELVFRN
jgi:hypothetical protein